MLVYVDLALHYFIFITVSAKTIWTLKTRENAQLESHIKYVISYIMSLGYITLAKSYESEDLLGKEFGLFRHWLLRASRLMMFDFMRMDEDCFQCFNRC